MLRPTIGAAIIGLVLSFSTEAMAFSLTGNDVLRRCDGPYTNDMEKLAFTSFCTGYLQGLQQMQHVVIGLRNVPPLYCEPTESGNYDQLQRVVIKWLKNNPDQLHRDARVLVTKALMEAFPCR